ncbi:MAG: hypothetical protein ISS49_10510 [Anaerolineae bacterium]|nr:hypothetical protein [Anaerolineae bacterium]
MIIPFQPAPHISSLAGRWQSYFPPDFDIDSTLQEIRHEWEEEWMDAPILTRDPLINACADVTCVW